MSPSLSALAVLVLMTPVMLLTAYWDLKAFRIPNWLVGATVLVFFIAVAPSLGWGGIGWRLIGALIVFAIGVFCFMVLSFGAGDVKMATALALFVPSAHAMFVLLLFGVMMLAGLFLVRVIGYFVTPADTGIRSWGVWSRRTHFPLGFSIAITALIYFALRFQAGGA